MHDDGKRLPYAIAVTDYGIMAKYKTDNISGEPDTLRGVSPVRRRVFGNRSQKCGNRRRMLSLQNKELFPVVVIIIMEAFINKMRRLKGIRKQLIVEEAWKALSTPNMAEYLKYMYKTVRK